MIRLMRADVESGEVNKIPEEQAQEIVPAGLDEDEVLEMFDGPRIFAELVDEGEDEAETEGGDGG